jgi:solute carrier family 66 (lysosomal lysine-arginine transporter), member 1
VENYRSGSADGVSLAFLSVWLIGDIANFFGSVVANLVPTVIALAVYFCFADAVLIVQCIYYNLINRRKRKAAPADGDARDAAAGDDPREPLLRRRSSDNMGLPGSRRRSSASHRRRDSSVRGALPTIEEEESAGRIWLRNGLSLLAVTLLGGLGWMIAWKIGAWKPTPAELPEPAVAGDADTKAVVAAVLGYFSALCYLG